MSVRRLAEPALQPASFAFNRANTAWAKKTIQKYPKGREQSAVIPLMMRAQEQEGWLTKPAIESIADMIGMAYIRALEVATFYTQFQLKPVGTRAHVQVCGTTPCMLRGAGELMDVCRHKIHHEQFHTNAKGTLSWEEVECLGACVNAPMVMIFKDTYEDLTPERLEEIIDQFGTGKGASVPAGPQNGRRVSEPFSGLTSLTNEKAILKTTRERETRAAARAARAEAAAPPAATVPPSRAAKPKTNADVTNGTLKTPSPVKTRAAAEKSASIAPAHDPVAANMAEPAVERTTKQRKSPTGKSGDPAMKSPELLRGEPIGAASKKSVAIEKPSLSDADRPPKIEAPATPDDLKRISGVGPRIEATLHSLGIYTFAQVAAWTKAECDWVDGYLNFKGRIERDDWIKQAAALAKGEDEYVRVFGKKPV